MDECPPRVSPSGGRAGRLIFRIAVNGLLTKSTHREHLAWSMRPWESVPAEGAGPRRAPIRVRTPPAGIEVGDSVAPIAGRGALAGNADRAFGRGSRTPRRAWGLAQHRVRRDELSDCAILMPLAIASTPEMMSSPARRRWMRPRRSTRAPAGLAPEVEAVVAALYERGHMIDTATSFADIDLLAR
jgi:hypothetical protein